VWIGARDAGLSHLDPRTGAIAVHRNDPANPASISEDDVDALYRDRAGNLWIGTWNGGVDMVDPYAQSFRTLENRLGVADSLPDNDVIAITETPDGPPLGRLAQRRPRRGRSAHRSRLRTWSPRARHARPRDVARARRRSSVRRHAARARHARRRDPPPSFRSPPRCDASALDQRSIDDLAVGGRGELWIVSGRALLVATPEARAGHRRGAEHRGALLDRHRGSGAAGLGTALDFLLDRRAAARRPPAGPAPALTLRHVTAPGARGAFDADAYVSSLHEDGAGHLWVGTRRGLGELDLVSGEERWFGRRGDLPSVDVGGVLEDGDGRIWFATNRGLTRLEPRSGATSYFGSREGAQGTGYAEGAFAKGASGLLYFAGHGITAFDPREISVDPNPPPIVLTGIEVLHRKAEPRWLDPRSPLPGELPSVRSITLGPEASVFSIEMAALHFGDPRRNGFAYRLEGFDRDWIRTDAQRAVATYTRLAPGDYLFRARAVTKNGIWSVRDATLAIHVLPVWWRTGPAIAGWSLLALLALIALWADGRRRTRVRLALLERETLRRASITDPLTGLYNRRFMAGWVEHEVPRPLREHDAGRATGESGMLFLLTDIDHFKSINDRFSHSTGDRVLAAVAQTLRAQIRDSDLAVRWGGDEFLVVSRSFGPEHASAAAERLRIAVESLVVAEDLPRCTVSIGWAAFPFLADDPRGLTWEQTLDLADHALHLTKRRRRNSWTGLVARPDARAVAVLAFLAAGPDAPPADAVEVVTTAERVPV
jgi:diguanylate cyclase (GGDEF)-like protein